MRVATNKKL